MCLGQKNMEFFFAMSINIKRDCNGESPVVKTQSPYYTINTLVSIYITNYLHFFTMFFKFLTP